MGTESLAFLAAILASGLVLISTKGRQLLGFGLQSMAGVGLLVGILALSDWQDKEAELVADSAMSAISASAVSAAAEVVSEKQKSGQLEMALLKKESEIQQILNRTNEEKAAAAVAVNAAEAALKKAIDEIGTISCHNGCEITIADNRRLLFGVDEFELASEDKDALAPVLAYIAFKMGRGLKSVVVTGHTDNSGASAHNKVLSERRALAVKAFLSNGIPQSLISTRGEGMMQPFGFDTSQEPEAIRNSNATPKMRAMNRRVEIRVELIGDTVERPIAAP